MLKENRLLQSTIPRVRFFHHRSASMTRLVKNRKASTTSINIKELQLQVVQLCAVNAGLGACAYQTYSSCSSVYLSKSPYVHRQNTCVGWFSCPAPRKRESPLRDRTTSTPRRTANARHVTIWWYYPVCSTPLSFNNVLLFPCSVEYPPAKTFHGARYGR